MTIGVRSAGGSGGVVDLVCTSGGGAVVRAGRAVEAGAAGAARGAMPSAGAAGAAAGRDWEQAGLKRVATGGVNERGRAAASVWAAWSECSRRRGAECGAGCASGIESVVVVAVDAAAAAAAWAAARRVSFGCGRDGRRLDRALRRLGARGGFDGRGRRRGACAVTVGAGLGLPAAASAGACCAAVKTMLPPAVGAAACAMTAAPVATLSPFGGPVGGSVATDRVRHQLMLAAVSVTGEGIGAGWAGEDEGGSGMEGGGSVGDTCVAAAATLGLGAMRGGSARP